MSRKQVQDSQVGFGSISQTHLRHSTQTAAKALSRLFSNRRSIHLPQGGVQDSQLAAFSACGVAKNTRPADVDWEG